jgi:hypothetical protein
MRPAGSPPDLAIAAASLNSGICPQGRGHLLYYFPGTPSRCQPRPDWRPRGCTAQALRRTTYIVVEDSERTPLSDEPD